MQQTQTVQKSNGQVSIDAAKVYESFFVPALFQQWPDKILQRIHSGNHQRILDVACGTGILARSLYENGVAPEIHGLDLNEGMLTVAKSKTARIFWHLGRAENLPFAEGYFDSVVSQFGLMFFQDPVKAIQEMYRVLRQGGYGAIAVWDTLENTPGYAAVAEMLFDLFGDAVANEIRAPYSMGLVTQLKKLFLAAGINKFNVKTIIGNARFSSLQEWMYTDIQGWTLAGKIDPEQFERILQQADKYLGNFIQKDGGVLFDTPAHIVSFSKI